MDPAGCYWVGHIHQLFAGTVESIRRVGRLRKSYQQYALPWAGLGSAQLDVHDVSHGSLPAAQLDVSRARLSDLGNESGGVPSEQSAFAHRQRSFFLRHRPPLARHRLFKPFR